MPSLDNLTLTDASDLKTEASGFANSASDFNTITNQMLETVNDSLASGWEGEASTAYNTKFNNLRKEMDHIYKMCEEYSNDLIQIADRYIDVEGRNQEIANKLNDELGMV